MVIFKAFLKILSRNKGILIMYTAILVVFSIFSVKSNETTVNFQSTKPDLCILNQDVDEGITHSLVEYLGKHNNIIELPDDAESLDDALFYRKVNFIIEIPAGFRQDFLEGKNPTVDYRSTGDYNASLARMSLTRYLQVAQSFRVANLSESSLIQQIESALAQEVPVELTNVHSTIGVPEAAFYYNFLNYPLIAGCVFMICLSLLSFRNQKIARRIYVSSTHTSQVNHILLGANILFALAIWVIYVLMSFVVVGTGMLSSYGLMFILNSLIFTCCVTALAFLIANLVTSRNALNGIVNVVGLGTSFLCGAFVPLEWLPESVKVIAHVLPSYWYIDANEKIKALEEFSWENLWPIFGCLFVVLAFTLAFVLLTNLISLRQKRQKRLK